MRIANYVNGQLVAPAEGKYLDNIDPATARAYSEVPDSTEQDVQQAVAAASEAFPKWSRMPTTRRSEAITRIADLLESKSDEFARAECVDNGKPLTVAAMVDIPRAVSNLRFFATAVLHTHSESHSTDQDALNYTLRKPRGVAGLISPWNLPLYLLTWKIAPALATGNTVVAKPSEITPMTAYMLSELCIQAKLPPGVLNIVHGTGPNVGAAIVSHPDTTAISFTGSTRTGHEIARVAAPMFKKLALEMGGKNPNVIFADADVNEATKQSVLAAFANQGQVCLCGSRVFVEQPLYDEFVDRFVERTKKLVIGDPLEPATQHGALVSKMQLDKVESYVELACQDGGQVLCGGQRPPVINDRCQDGFFYEPTVVTDLSVDCRVNQEEIFGPLVTIAPFEDEQQVIDYANATPYGLSASVWTRDITRAHRVAEHILAGTVWVNCWMLRDLRVPFGGMKQSGVGREGGDEALRFFTEPKNVCVKLG